MSSLNDIIMGRGNKIIVLSLKVFTIAAIVFTLAGMVYTLFSNDVDYTIDVRPASDASRQTLAQYNNNTITATGVMTTSDPGLKATLLWTPHSNYLSNFIEGFFIICVALQVFFILSNASRSELSVEKLAKYLHRLGIAIILFHLANLIRKSILKKQVLSITNNKFRLDEDHTIGVIWLGVILIALAAFIKENASLKKEQELTI